jgi:hypothetical protein
LTALRLACSAHRNAMRERTVEELRKIMVFENEVEARLLESILEERGIPHLVRAYHDSAYDGLFQFQKGWGHLEAPSRFEREIAAIYDDVRR